MQTLTGSESRKVLDAMGIPVFVLRDRPIETQSSRGASTGDAHDAGAQTLGAADTLEALRDAVGDSPRSAQPEAVSDSPLTHPEPADAARKITEDVPDDASDTLQSVSFSLVSVITDEIQVLAELPAWAGGLLDGRMTAVLSDLLRVMGGDGSQADWQYFRWPIDGMPDHSTRAATEAVDAWLHRRWAEMQAAEPVMLTSIQTLDASVLTADALMLPPVEALLTDPKAKRALWEQIQSRQHG